MATNDSLLTKPLPLVSPVILLQPHRPGPAGGVNHAAGGVSKSTYTPQPGTAAASSPGYTSGPGYTSAGTAGQDVKVVKMPATAVHVGGGARRAVPVTGMTTSTY